MFPLQSRDSLFQDDDRPNKTWPISLSGPAGPFVFITIFGVTLSLVLLVNRLFWRFFRGKPGLDDIFIIIAWFSLLALAIISLEAVKFGYGRPQKELLRSEASDAIRMFFVFQILYKITINFSKLSILALYIRVFGAKDWFGKVTQTLMLVVAFYIVSSVIATCLQCRPIRKSWDTTNSVQGECIDLMRFWYANALYNIISEAIMVFTVLSKVWKLENVKRGQKISLSFALGLGVFVFVTSILRMTTLAPTALTNDKTGGTLTSTMWSTIEASLAIVCASLPMMRQLIRAIWPDCLEMKRSGGSSNMPHGGGGGTATTLTTTTAAATITHHYNIPTNSHRPFADSPEPLVRRQHGLLDPFSDEDDISSSSRHRRQEQRSSVTNLTEEEEELSHSSERTLSSHGGDGSDSTEAIQMFPVNNSSTSDRSNKHFMPRVSGPLPPPQQIGPMAKGYIKKV